MFKVFIDGKEGTTGLRIFDRLSGRTDIELVTLPEATRKDPKSRRRALNDCDIAILCLRSQRADAVSMIVNEAVRVIDDSSAHRTGRICLRLSRTVAGRLRRLRSAKRVSVPVSRKRLYRVDRAAMQGGVLSGALF
jgi:N-acetyl-gamma-glutamyl-phosphate reductase